MISVVTPTYNRAYVIENLKNSLTRQTSFDFEWLVIDDGSTDNTSKLVKKWAEETTDFKIRYYYHENGGKHRALNFGIPFAEGEYIFVVDSDDFLTDDAVENIKKWVSTIDSDSSIVGVAGLRGYPDGKKIGDFPENREFVDVKNSHRYTHHLDGDKAEVYRKSALISYPFPEFEGERFIGEGAVWNRLSLEGYKVRWFGKIIYVCEYLEDGLTRNSNKLNKENFKGYTYNVKQNYKAIVYPYNLMAVAVYTGVAKELGYSEKQVRKEINVSWPDWIACKIIRFIRRMP